MGSHDPISGSPYTSFPFSVKLKPGLLLIQVFKYLFVSLCISLYLFVSLCISLYLFVSLCISLYLFVSLCISLYLFVLVPKDSCEQHQTFPVLHVRAFFGSRPAAAFFGGSGVPFAQQTEIAGLNLGHHWDHPQKWSF